MLSLAEFKELAKTWHFSCRHRRIANDDKKSLLAAHGYTEAIRKEKVTESSAFGSLVRTLDGI